MNARTLRDDDFEIPEVGMDDDDEDFADCGLHPDGQCSMAGTEWCDFECPYRDSELFAGSTAWRIKHGRRSEMNAYSTTLRDIASAITSRPRVEQSVHLSSTIYRSPDAPRHIVLVIPHGQDKGEYYEVSDKAYRLLQDGASPEYLELDPVDYDTFEEV